MNRIKSWVRAFFGFSRNETNAFLILLPMMFLIVFIIPVYKAFFTQEQNDYSQEIKSLDSLIAQWKTPNKKEEVAPSVNTLFHFNPNNSSTEELTKLGFSPYMTTRLENYRKKGGKFFIKSDLLKLYGMDTSLYTTLYTWIDLPVERQDKLTEASKAAEQNRRPVKEKFDLNLADSLQLSAVYGIGPKLSVRIIKYRDRLGGYISAAQLNEVYGLDSTVIQELKKESFISETFQPRRYNINTVTEKELATHPYIKYAIAKSITAYRFQHGEFKSIDDLTQIAIIDKVTYEKIKPYLSINP